MENEDKKQGKREKYSKKKMIVRAGEGGYWKTNLEEEWIWWSRDIKKKIKIGGKQHISNRDAEASFEEKDEYDKKKVGWTKRKNRYIENREKARE